MKKVAMASLVSGLFVLALCLVLPLSAYAVDKLIVKDAGGVNTVFVVTDTGNVGVSTATPTAKIQIGTVNPPDIGTPWDFYSYNASYGRVAIDSGINNAGLEFLENTTRTWFIGSFSGLFAVYDTVSSAFRMAINNSGNVGIGTLNPTNPLQMASGAHVTPGGAWTNASSRDYKENIQELTTLEAIETFSKLEPVKYNYKIDQNEKHVGFIAEDVPALVATQDRKGLSSMDIVAVLTKVVQEQQKTISEMKEKMDELQNEVRLKNGFAALDVK